MQHVGSFERRSVKRRRGEGMKAVFKTDRGLVRPHNEDNGGIFKSDNGSILAVVADGVGGHLAGDVASEMAVRLLKERWENTPELTNPEEAESWLKDIIKEINRHLYTHSKENEECKGMGTTIVAVICNQLFTTVAHIGDSRCYIDNELGFSQLTEDHSLVNELVRSGQISKEDAEHHPRKNVILRALGTEEQVELDVKTISFEEGDSLLLCSDGLSDKLAEEELANIVKEQEVPLSVKVEKLVNLANEKGGEDNISIILIQYEVNDSNESGETL